MRRLQYTSLCEAVYIQIALHPAMTVMAFFTPCPRTRVQAPPPFGILSFQMNSSVPDTSFILLIKNATSIHVSI